MTEPLIRYPFTDEGLKAALDALGTTPDAVATLLFGMGFQGRRAEPACCPIARYLKASIEGADTCSVRHDADDAALYVIAESETGVVDVIAGSTPLSSFLFRFDMGLYPDLIDRES